MAEINALINTFWHNIYITFYMIFLKHNLVQNQFQNTT